AKRKGTKRRAPDTGNGTGTRAVAGHWSGPAFDGPDNIVPVGRRGHDVMAEEVIMINRGQYSHTIGVIGMDKQLVRELEVKFWYAMINRWAPVPDGVYLSPEIIGKSTDQSRDDDRDTKGVLFDHYFKNEPTLVRQMLANGAARADWSVYLVISPYDTPYVIVHPSVLVQHRVATGLEYYYYEPYAAHEQPPPYMPDVLDTVLNGRASDGQWGSVEVRRAYGSQGQCGDGLRRCLIFIANFLDDSTVLCAYNWSPYAYNPRNR
ncbi:unnamed protein product, partial [Medioppia subpectinata]